MFLWSYRQVGGVLVLMALFMYLMVKGEYSTAEPWIHGFLYVLIFLAFMRLIRRD